MATGISLVEFTTPFFQCMQVKLQYVSRNGVLQEFLKESLF